MKINGEEAFPIYKLRIKWDIFDKDVKLIGSSGTFPTFIFKEEKFKDKLKEFAKDYWNRYRKKNLKNVKCMVTEIGCGLAGIKHSKIAPLFKDALSVENIWLPQSFYDILIK